MIPDSFVQDLLARVDIVDTVERFVPLKKTGANYAACCPFHSEKTPSFTVSPAKQFYYCFGCGAHGSAIGFLMQYSGLGFVEAMEELAHNAGMQVPQVMARERHERAMKAPLTELMARAAKFYGEQLKDAPKAVAYLKERGLTGEIAKRFGLGYAPDAWQGLQAVFPDYNDAALAECGLVVVNEQGRRYDRFRDRVMFPILDPRSNVIGFGGRFIGDHKAAQGENPAAGPKYLNSPETPLFEKGRELYGLTQARQGIRDTDQVIVVEGYMDVVALAQMGVPNAVATLGTACTAEHVGKLLRQAAKIVFCFDGDAAGRKAAWRALEASLAQLTDDRSVGFLFLPPEHDPDSFVREHGAQRFIELATQPTPLSEFLLRELKSGLDLTRAEDRARLVFEAKPHLQKLAALGLRMQLTQSIAAEAQLSPAEVEAQCGLKPAARASARYARTRNRAAPRSLEYQLLAAVLPHPERTARIPLEHVSPDSPEGALLHAIANAIDHGELPSGGVGMLLEFFRGTPHETLLAAQAGVLADAENADAEHETELEEVFADAIEQLRKKDLTREIDALTAKMREGTLGHEEHEQLRELLARKAGGAKNSRL